MLGLNNSIHKSNCIVILITSASFCMQYNTCQSVDYIQY